MPISVYLDLSKAFDTLDHKILLHKLKYYGVCDSSLKWFHSYLTNRQQHVSFDDTVSSALPLKTGVPQGSILGPLLFIIYTNDIYRASQKFDSILYADDTTLITPLCSFNSSVNLETRDASDKINEELTKIHNWLSVNKLSLNIAKTKFMVFHFPQRRVIPTLDIKINNIAVSRTTEFNFLGLFVNETLNWNTHVNKIATKLSRLIGMFKRIHKFLPVKTLLLIYNSLFLPHLNYSILAWGYSWDRIFKLQKSAIRLICHERYNAHTDPLFKSLKLLKLQDIYKHKALKFYYRYSQNQIPEYFKNMFDFPTLTHPYETRNRHIPQLPISKLNKTSNCIRYHIPTLLKNTPPCILDKVHTHSMDGYSKYIKSYLINQYSEICTLENCYVCAT